MKLFNGTIFCCYNRQFLRWERFSFLHKLKCLTILSHSSCLQIHSVYFLNYAKKVARYGCETIICILYIDIFLKYVLQFMGNVTYLVNLFMFLVLPEELFAFCCAPPRIYIHQSISVHLFSALFRFDVLILFRVLCFHMQEKKKKWRRVTIANDEGGSV